jgi:hypothetical protein
MPESQETVVPVQEGSRWRHAKPSADEVARWFELQPIDERMAHADYVSGVVVIKASEKVKKPKPDGRGTEEVWEETHTPYVRVDTRVAYFRRLAALDGLIAVIKPVSVPRVEGEGAFANAHMAEGFWWYVGGSREQSERYVCCTMRVALIHPSVYYVSGEEGIPVLEGQATKAVKSTAFDENALAMAETGAIGRALGVAGILVVGSGIATAEDMAELRGEELPANAVSLPPPPEESEEQLAARLADLEARLRMVPDAWSEFANWWKGRSQVSGWKVVGDAPIEARRGVAVKMEGMLDALPEPEQPTAAGHAVEGGTLSEAS